MGLLDFLRPSQPAPEEPQATAVWTPSSGAYAEDYADLKDPRLAVFLRGGPGSATGYTVSVQAAMRNTAVFRAVSIISNSIGMLPLHLLKGEDFDKDKAKDHPLFKILYREPNNWQTAYDFRSHMQANVLVHGNAYARVVRSIGRVTKLVPMDPTKTTPEQGDNWDVSYRYTAPNGDVVTLGPKDVFHLRGLSLDGICGLSMVKQAAEAIGISLAAEQAAGRLFRNGMLAGGVLKHKSRLSKPAQENLIAALEARNQGAENAAKWMVLEEDMDAKTFSPTAVESQHLETRRHQIEEIGRIFGVPRPLLGVDETSWGTGIEQLGIGFVRYALAPWFTAWEQAIVRTLLTPAEQEIYTPKFNEGALLRGSMKDQADFFAKALGAGGHQPWMHVNEVRGLMNLAERDDLAPPLAPAAGALPEGPPNDAAAAA